jgi:predicted amidophosphoribosyltransferase
MFGMQRALSLIYPNQCILCSELVNTPGGLCASCWKDVEFIRGLVCDTCGLPLPGDKGNGAVFCDTCLAMPRAWCQGRAAFLYSGGGRRFVLALKHGDRPELARPASVWLEQAAHPFLTENAVVVPVPSHWSRTVQRRYNQSAELARAFCDRTKTDYLPDALVRVRRTGTQDGRSIDERFANLQDAVQPHPKRGFALEGRDVCLLDDVMTSGATMSAATAACHAAGARQVSVLVLARVAKAT